MQSKLLDKQIKPKDLLPQKLKSAESGRIGRGKTFTYKKPEPKIIDAIELLEEQQEEKSQPILNSVDLDAVARQAKDPDSISLSATAKNNLIDDIKPKPQ